MDSNPLLVTKWRRLSDLGQGLLARPQLAAQRELILEAAADLADGEASLWITHDLRELAEGPAPSPTPQPPSTLMRRALESASLVTDGPIMAFPLSAAMGVVGVLEVRRAEGSTWGEDEVALLRALAAQSAAALQVSHLIAVASHRGERLSGVAEVSRAVTSILDLDELLDRVVTLIHQQFDYPSVQVFTVDLARHRIVYRAGWPPGPSQDSQTGLPICTLDDSEGLVAWVACHGEAALVNDVRSDARYRPLARQPIDVRSQLAVPLVFGDDVLGVLDVQTDRPDAFGDHDRLLLEALADSVAVAIRNAALYESERWRRRIADRMRDVAGLLSSRTDPSDVLDAVLTSLGSLLPCDVSAIWLLEGDTLCLSAVQGAAEQACVSDPLSDADGWLRRALQADAPIVRVSGAPPEPLGAALGFPSDYSAITAPLTAGGRRLGLLTLAHRTPGRYGTESRNMTAAFANYAAVAIENARLYQQAQEQAYVSTVLLQVAELTQSLATLDDVLDAVVRLMPMLVGADRCALFFWDESDQTFALARAGGLGEQPRASHDLRISPSDVPAFNRLRITKEPLWVDSLPSETAGPVPPLLGGFESPLLLPLRAHGDLLGAMLVDYQSVQDIREPQALQEKRMAIMRGVAYQVAAAAENARLLEARQEEAYVSAALLQVARAVASLGDLDEVLETVVRIGPMLVGVERCAIFLWSHAELAFLPAKAFGMSMPGHPLAPGQFPLLDAVRERNELIALETPHEIVGQVPPEIASHLGEGRTTSTGALLGVPLSVKGEVLGVMLVGESDRAKGPADRRLEIVTGIAQQAALAVQNDRLQKEMAERERLERELQLAREIQETFLPDRLPSLPGWELAVTWRAARQVAGDFYDVLELPDRRIGLVIADVADKGMPAALFMALTRTLMRAAATDAESPAEALTQVNDLLVPDARHGMFVTGLYVTLSLATGDLLFANAGHHPPLVFRSGDRSLQQLERGETALGVKGGVQYEDHVNTIGSGDALILYTDGVTEALSQDGALYGEERLREHIESVCGRRSAQETLDSIVGAVVDFTGDNPLSDDLTLMVVRRSD